LVTAGCAVLLSTVCLFLFFCILKFFHKVFLSKSLWLLINENFSLALEDKVAELEVDGKIMSVETGRVGKGSGRKSRPIL